MIIGRKMLKNTFLFIFSVPEIIISLCFVCLDPEILFSHLCPFSRIFFGIWVSMVTSRRYGANFTGENILLTFQMEQNETF